MAKRDVIVIGGSAGAIEALCTVVRALPAAFPASILVVCHIPSTTTTDLPAVLSRRGPLLAGLARDGEPIYPGHIYIAPPDYHLLVEPGTLRLSRAARENRQRPAIDPLMRSAARVYGPRVVGLILSGALWDGVAGLMAVRRAGGVAVVQSPDEAVVNTMPTLARQLAGADHVVPTVELAPLLTQLVTNSIDNVGGQPMIDPLDPMPQKVAQDMASQVTGDRNGQVSLYTCPECGGSLWQAEDRQMVQFRCHTGHVYHGEALLQEQSDCLDAALWTAVRTFKEKAMLAEQLAFRERERGNEEAAGRFDEEAGVARQYCDVLQRYLLNPHKPTAGPATAPLPNPAASSVAVPNPSSGEPT